MVLRVILQNDVERAPQTIRLGDGNGEGATRVLWHAGFIANRGDLEASLVGRPSAGNAPAGDRELLAQAYATFGAQGAAARIAGSVSWLLWDADRERLIAISDRIGVHPIFYRQEADGWHVSDSVEALLDGTAPAKPNPRALLMYVNMLGPLPGETYYDGIHQVLPGRVMTFTRAGPLVETYWHPDAVTPLVLSTDGEYAEALRTLLCDVVGAYLPDGPTGFTLSGGLDSTSVAAAARASAPHREMAAISWSMPELPSSDETPYSSHAAEHLHLRQLGLRADAFWPLIHAEGVRTNRNAPWQSLYSELYEEMGSVLVENGIRTLLSGIDGDRLFSTVTSYPDLLLTGRWPRLAREMGHQVAASERKLSTLGTTLKILLRDTIKAYRPLWRRGRPVPWAHPDTLADLRTCVQTLQYPERGLPGRRARIRLTRDVWIGQILPLLTQLMARKGIDFRHPLLDHRLFEFAIAIPSTQMYRAGVMKYVLRNAMRDLLPPEIVDLPSKVFTPIALVHRGLRERESAKVWPLLRETRSAELGLIDEARLQAHYRGYLEGEPYDGSLWYHLTLEDWLRRYF